MKKGIIALSVLVASGVHAQAMLTQALDTAKQVASKSGVDINAQVAIIKDNAKVDNNSSSTGSESTAVAGANAIANKGRPNAVAAINAQIAIIQNNATIKNNSSAQSGGTAVTGANAMSVSK